MAITGSIHTFHIPVMGLAYTIDSPIRVAQYGISSVISIIDDDLVEKMRAFYCRKLQLPYTEISKKNRNHRAERIMHYLNLVDIIVKEKFEAYKNELIQSRPALEHYISMLPNKSELKKKLQEFIVEGMHLKDAFKAFIHKNLYPGSIDVNIMTKIDKDNFSGDDQLPIEYNDAHAAFRGFAGSTLHSSLVFSAGMNPRLYGYVEHFKDFFPDANLEIKKKIILKVSDYRSAFIQGSFLAKKGIWVSEYRIESGLNCGGHAFATNGHLLGPILQEFKDKKEELIQSTHALLIQALGAKKLPVPPKPFPLKISVQGGVGTAGEHSFLLEHYHIDSVGWGSPFLLVPEATMVDNDTRQLLINAKESDFYLSNISPLGVPFNSVKGVSNDYWKQKRIDERKAGSSCPKKFLALNKDYDERGMCTASKKYQDIKLKELSAEKEYMSADEFRERKKKITEKACLCVGLANSGYLANDIPVKGQQQGVVICPGPNLAYFDKEVSLAEMIRHIYGNAHVMTQSQRPNMFIKELKMYVEYLKKEIAGFRGAVTSVQIKKWDSFKSNLLEGIRYYEEVLLVEEHFREIWQQLQEQLEWYKSIVEKIAVKEEPATAEAIPR